MKTTSYWDAIISDNKALECAGMPYRYGADGIAICAKCGQKYFRADRIDTQEKDCEHYEGDEDGAPNEIP